MSAPPERPHRNVRDHRLDRTMDPRRCSASAPGCSSCSTACRSCSAGSAASAATGATVPLVSQMGLAGVLETFGGLLLVLGLFTRPVAFLLAGEMLVAFFQVHLPRGGAPIQNGGELPLLYMLVFLFFVGHGAGPASLDARSAGP